MIHLFLITITLLSYNMKVVESYLNLSYKNHSNTDFGMFQEKLSHRFGQWVRSRTWDQWDTLNRAIYEQHQKACPEIARRQKRICQWNCKLVTLKKNFRRQYNLSICTGIWDRYSKALMKYKKKNLERILSEHLIDRVSNCAKL